MRCLPLLLVLLTGCAASSGRLNKIHIGMTKQEAIRVLGTPRSSVARGGTETLLYQFTDKPFGDGMIFPGSYGVTVADGKVVGWGRDEEKDRMDRERAYQMNSAALAPRPVYSTPTVVNVY